MKISTVHMRLGENIGNVMRDIAREHILYDYDIQKALEVYTQGIGCNISIAKDLILGKLEMVIENPDSSNVFVQDGGDNFDINSWADRKIKDLNETSSSLSERYQRILNHPSPFRNIVVNVHVSKKYLKTLDETQLLNDVKDGIDSNLYLSETKDLLKDTNKLFNDFIKLNKIFNFFNIDIIPFSISDCLNDIKDYYTQLIEIATNNNQIGEVNVFKEFLDAEQKIRHTKKIAQCDITKKYDAGWLSPTGIFYGLNGTTANLLHLAIADKLKDIFNQKDNLNFDEYLESHGWLKIHNDWVVGYKVKLTEEQIKMISVYGNACYNGVLKFGCSQQPCSIIKFNSMENIMQNNLVN